MTARRRVWIYAGLTALVVPAAVVGVMATRNSKRPAASQVYCGPDGRLTTTAPIQSHRSYCVRAFSAVEKLQPGVPTDFSFEIIDDRGATLQQFATVHEKVMHVIVVRHDLTQFQHVHPIYEAKSGRFTVSDLAFPDAGPYRLFADFTPQGAMAGPDGQPLGVTVPVDLQVGDGAAYRPETLPPRSDTASVGDYEVTLSRPDTLRAGAAQQLTFSIHRGGVVASDLEPYLGANGHAVVLREGDLAFIHSHALEDQSALRAGQLPFIVNFAEPGRYRMFVQFKHRGAVQTAAITLPGVVTAAAGAISGGHEGH
jgi:hypothetical protein